jgi:hypothetical protein
MNATFFKQVMVVTLLLAVSSTARAGTNGLAEAGVGVVLPVGGTSYRQEFDVSPTLWLAGVYLPHYGNRSLGVEMALEYTPYQDEYVANNGAPTDFSRLRAQLGGRYLRTLAPDLTGFARALAGVDLVTWTQNGKLGRLTYSDDDTHLGLALEFGAGVLYRVGPITLGAQLAVPIGVHRQTIYDKGVAIDRDAFDVELRLTVGNNY